MSEGSLITLHTFETTQEWAQAAAQEIAEGLSHHQANYGVARLFLSGGTTPAAVYTQLAEHVTDWSHIAIHLVDERWLPPGHSANNATLIHQHLLNKLSHHHFSPLVRPGLTIDACVAAANYEMSLFTTPSIMVLGMGDDGHTASLFPGSTDLHGALNSPFAYTALNAAGCPVANAWPLRITLTPTGMANASLRYLLIRGDRKRAVLDNALKATDPTAYPIRVALRDSQAPVQVYWCP